MAYGISRIDVGALILIFSGGGCSKPDLPVIAKPPCDPTHIQLDDGTCLEPGVPQDLPCPPGKLQVEGGGCQTAGVPPNGCGKGFVFENDGCRAILPADPCPFGQMAIPGETECHEVSSCGEGPWGDIPIEPNTQFVDRAYPGNDSDGSETRPWQTIQEGIEHANPGDMVAVAAGTYPEDVFINFKPIRLWGRCPQMVEISGSGLYDASLSVYAALSAHSEVHGVAITSTHYGLAISSVENVLVDHVWIHDVLVRGLNVQDDGVPTSATIKNSLIENTSGAGGYVKHATTSWEGVEFRDNVNEFAFGVVEEQANSAGNRSTMRGCVFNRSTNAAVVTRGAEMLVEDSVFREITPGTYPAQGITATNSQASRGHLTVRGCVLERNYGSSLSVLGATAMIENTTIRDSQLDSMGLGGNGMTFMDSLETKQRANVTLRASLVDRAHDLGMGIWGSDVTIDGVLVRDMLPDGFANAGIGIYAAMRGKDGERPKVVIRSSIFDRCRSSGISLLGAEATIESSIVRATIIGEDEIFGRGIGIDYFYPGKMPSDVTIRSCLIEKNHEFGIFIHGSRTVIESSTIRETAPNKVGFGRGINIQGHPSIDLHSDVLIRTSLISENHESGLFVAESEVNVEDSIIRDTKATEGSLYGDGISLRYGSNVNFNRVTVEHNARAGIASFGSRAQVNSSTIRCNAFDIEGEFADGLGFSYDGSSKWKCSEIRSANCMTLGECNVRSAGLMPPPSLASGNP